MAFAGTQGVDVGPQERHRLRHRARGDRHDRVDGDLGPREFERPGAHHADDAGLGGGVVGLPEVADLAGGRTDADDPAALTLLPHPDRGGAGAGEGTPKMRGDDGVELLVGHFPEGRIAQDPCVVHQDIQPAVLTDRPIDQCLRGLGGADRYYLRGGRAAVLVDRLHDGIGDPLVDVVDDDRGAAAGELDGVGQAQAAPASGDNGDLAGEIHDDSLSTVAYTAARRASRVLTRFDDVTLLTR